MPLHSEELDPEQTANLMRALLTYRGRLMKNRNRLLGRFRHEAMVDEHNERLESTEELLTMIRPEWRKEHGREEDGDTARYVPGP